MFFANHKLVKEYHTVLKGKVTSFLIEFRKKMKHFPIKLISKYVKQDNFKKLSKLIISGEKIDTQVAIRQMHKKYKELEKECNPYYFNPILQGFKNDCRKVKEDSEIKHLYQNYEDEMKMEFKQMDIDLRFCVDVLKELGIGLREYNKNPNED